MKKIIAAVKRDRKKQLKNFIAELNEVQSVEELRDNWRIKRYITPTYMKKDVSLTFLKAYVKNRAKNQYLSTLEEEVTKIEAINEAQPILSININVEWKTNRTWGANPKAEVRVNYKDNSCEYFHSGSISGCGYDKESTAIAEALNQSHSVLKMLYNAKNKNIDKSNGDIFSYGIGGHETPRFSGGVGTNCYYRVFEKLGFKMEKVSSGKSFDVWTVRKK